MIKYTLLTVLLTFASMLSIWFSQFWWDPLGDGAFYFLHWFEDGSEICRGYNNTEDHEKQCYKKVENYKIMWYYLQIWESIYSKWKKIWKWKAVFHNKVFLEFDDKLLSEWEVLIENIWSKKVKILDDKTLVLIDKDLYHAKLGLAAKWFWEIQHIKTDKSEIITTEKYIEISNSTTYEWIFYNIELINRNRTDKIWYPYQFKPKDPFEIKIELSPNIKVMLKKFINEKWYTSSFKQRMSVIKIIEKNLIFLDKTKYLDHIEDLTSTEMKIQFMLHYIKEIIEG